MFRKNSYFDTDGQFEEVLTKALKNSRESIVTSKQGITEVPSTELERWYDVLNRQDNPSTEISDLRDSVYRYLR